jgi:RsiW-degrading membrane proteinase PrsW (M82 family)
MAQQQKALPKQRAGWWQSAIMAIVGVLVFTAIVVGLDAALKPELSGTALILVGVLLAIIPAVLWIVFFYVQDRVEPEPKKEVFKIFIVGLALASAIGIPLTDQVFKVGDWLYRSTESTALGAFFVIGAIEAFIVYVTVRFFMAQPPAWAMPRR